VIGLRRNRSAQAIPASFRGAHLARRANALIDLFYTAQASGKQMAFDSSVWKPAKGALKKETGGKCAYCEASTETVAHGDVEHFRPKSIYWWLAFCYDNYLFACQLCNQTHKGDNFPIAGALAAAPALPAQKPVGAALDALISQLTLEAEILTDADLVALWSPEDAHLVNPYFEDPAPLLQYEVDVANEEIWIRSAGGARADRALDSAERYLGLNRETLRRDRFVAYTEMLVMKEVLDAPSLPAPTRRMVERHIVAMQQQRRPFSGMLRWFAAQWELPGP
jgi:hypothetical protein